MAVGDNQAQFTAAIKCANTEEAVLRGTRSFANVIDSQAVPRSRDVSETESHPLFRRQGHASLR